MAHDLRRVVLVFLPLASVVCCAGDNPPHTWWEETMESQLDCTRRLTTMIRETLPGYPVYPTLGNHGRLITGVIDKYF